MQIFDSYIDAGQQLGKRDRQAYYTAIIEYLAYGRTPDLKGAPAALFTAIEPTLKNSRSRSRAACKRWEGKEAKGYAKADAKCK